MNQGLREAMSLILGGLAQIGIALIAVAVNFQMESISAVRPASASLSHGLTVLTTNLCSALWVREEPHLRTRGTQSLLLTGEAESLDAKEQFDLRPLTRGMSRDGGDQR